MAQTELAVRMSIDDAALLHRIRGTPAVYVACDGGELWLKSSSPNAFPVLQSVKGTCFELNASGDLIPIGQHLVQQNISHTEWQPLDDWLPVELPPVHWPENVHGTLPLKQIPSTRRTEADALLTTLAHIRPLINEATFRFQHLRFAMTPDGEVFVMGKPLPSIQGQRFCIFEGVAIPAGRIWAPQVDVETLRQIFGSPQGIVVWRNDRQWETIPDEVFTAMTRVAIRASALQAESRAP